MIIDGKLVASKIITDLKERVINLKNNNIYPKLAIILVGDKKESLIYIKNKLKKCEKLGIEGVLYKFNETDNEEDIINLINNLNNDNKTHGILIQLPLPSRFNENKIIRAVSPTKDVDGFSTHNLGCLLKNEEDVIAATPLGIIKLLDFYNIPISGQNVVIIGRSKIVGRPLLASLLNRDATVSICHTKTKNLKEYTLRADILIVAIGCPKFITSDYVKEGSVVIDVGINRVGDKIVGDVDFDNVEKKTKYITPVPGGVGPMTIACLLSNIVKKAEDMEERK